MNNTLIDMKGYTVFYCGASFEALIIEIPEHHTTNIDQMNVHVISPQDGKYTILRGCPSQFIFIKGK